MATLSTNARKLLQEKNFAFLATLNKDGSPQVTPTWVDTDGKNILVNVATSRQKFRNVSRDPRVAVALIDQTDPYKAVIVRGKVISIEKGPVAENHIDKMAKKYRGLEKYPNRVPGEQRVLLTVEPTRIVER